MKKFSFMVVVIIISFIIQTSLFNFFDIFGLPNLSLIVLVILAIMSDGIIGGILGITTGLLYDTMIYDVFGIYTLIYFVIGSLIGTYSDEMIRENYMVYTSVTAISTIAVHLFLYLILFFLKYRVGNASSIIVNIFVEMLLNTVLVVFVHKFIIYSLEKMKIK